MCIRDSLSLDPWLGRDPTGADDESNTTTLELAPAPPRVHGEHVDDDAAAVQDPMIM